MSYELYRGWVKNLDDEELGNEIDVLEKKVKEAPTAEVRSAWERMLHAATLELYRTNR